MSSKPVEVGFFGRLLRAFRGGSTGDAARERVTMASERRGELRVPVELRVALRFESIDDVVHSHTVNLSEGGMFIGTRSPRPEGTRVQISMDVGGRQVALSGIVVHRVSSAAAGRHPPGMGVQFVELGDDARSLVDEILARESAD